MTSTWAELTSTQRRYLIAACGRGLTPTVELVAIWALQDAGLIHRTTSRKGRVRWQATDLGRGLVASRGLIPTFLHQRSQYGYTHHHRQAMRDELESMGHAA